MLNEPNYPSVVKTFLEIVPIYNHSKQEDDLVLWLVEKITDLGLAYIEQDNFGNVLVNIKSNIPNNDQYIMFIAHLDSVMPCKNIIPVITNLNKEPVITSKGNTVLSADDKVGIAVLIEAIKYLKSNKISYPNIELVFTVQEEIGLLGSKSLDYHKFKSKMAYSIDAEAPVGTIVIQAPSQKQFEIVFKGKAAHAAMCPERGLNSIKMAADFLNSVPIGRIDSCTTSNIGMINGGLANNIVPEITVLTGEVRSLKEESLNELLNTYKLACKNITESYPRSSFVFKEQVRYHNFSIDSGHEVVQLAQRACDQLKIPFLTTSMGSGSDANVFNFNNIATVNLGSGFINSHSFDESITFSQLCLLESLIISIIKEAAKG